MLLRNEGCVAQSGHQWQQLSNHWKQWWNATLISAVLGFCNPLVRLLTSLFIHGRYRLDQKRCVGFCVLHKHQQQLQCCLYHQAKLEEKSATCHSPNHSIPRCVKWHWARGKRSSPHLVITHERKRLICDSTEKMKGSQLAENFIHWTVLS